MTRKKSEQDIFIDELLENISDPKDLSGKNGPLKQLTKRLVERILEAELSTHLGYEPNDLKGHGTGNNRKGKSRKQFKARLGRLILKFREIATEASNLK
jgi:transposase-like protein